MATAEANKYQHGEAFCHMTYESQDKRHREVIWNSRDGVTPFGVDSIAGKTLYHTHWQQDRREENYKPQPGDRIFVDATPELLRDAAERYVAECWDTKDQFGMCMSNHPVFENMTKEQAAQYFLEKWCEPGSPALVTVQRDGSYRHST